jgi:hypothetical protein
VLRREEFLNPAFDSWSQGVSKALFGELHSCGFLQSDKSSVEFIQALRKLDSGTPLFGDDFCTGWEYYSVIDNPEIAILVGGFQAALDFERKLPDSMPDDVRRRFKTRLLDDTKKFICDLIGWFEQIQQAGQDAFIIWY